MGGWKSLRIIGWVRHNGEVDLKMRGGYGGNPFQSNFVATKDFGATKLPPSDPMPQKYSASEVYYRTGTRYIFFYISMLVVSVIKRYE